MAQAQQVNQSYSLFSKAKLMPIDMADEAMALSPLKLMITGVLKELRLRLYIKSVVLPLKSNRKQKCQIR